MQSVQELRKQHVKVDYNEDSGLIKRFLLFFQEGDIYKYHVMLRNTHGPINLYLEDLALFDETGIVSRIENNAFTYLQLIQKVIDDILFNGEEHMVEEMDDVFLFQRISRLKEIAPDKKITEVLPGALLRNYTVNIIPRSTRTMAVRDVGAKQIGKMVRIRGIVTKTSQVKPAVQVVTYICESCGTEIYQSVENETFDALEECFSEKCRTRKIKGTLCVVTRGSKFIKHQNVQLQELTSDVPHGSIPRMINVECYADLTETVKPGEYAIISGIFLPRPYYGFKRLKAGLLNDVYLHCTHIETFRPLAAKTEDFMSIDTLVRCLAPEIYGMGDVKKILLLMLVGSPSLMREDGMKIRGDINVLLVGDPGIAKSQLLKTVVKISRRGVYTTGKGSSGVGLTAAVVKDPVTEEMILEGGALVLADRGICCIDELDKMDEFNRVAIHEVMEQQTVSISKAGINTTLNARCAVLAAANPVKGRYDPKKSVEHNMALPISLLSRFDVLCVLRDEADTDNDLKLASHVTSLHFQETVPEFDYVQIRSQIERCREVNPVLSRAVKDRLLEAYLGARKDPTTTPRYLLSLIRLTLAHARLRMSETATEEDAAEAVRLLSIMKVPAVHFKNTASLKREIYNFILGHAQKNENDESVIDLKALQLSAGYKRDDIESVINEFAASGIWIKRGDDELLVVN